MEYVKAASNTEQTSSNAMNVKDPSTSNTYVRICYHQNKRELTGRNGDVGDVYNGKRTETKE